MLETLAYLGVLETVSSFFVLETLNGSMMVPSVPRIRTKLSGVIVEPAISALKLLAMLGLMSPVDEYALIAATKDLAIEAEMSGVEVTPLICAAKETRVPSAAVRSSGVELAA